VRVRLAPRRLTRATSPVLDLAAGHSSVRGAGCQRSNFSNEAARSPTLGHHWRVWAPLAWAKRHGLGGPCSRQAPARRNRRDAGVGLLFGLLSGRSSASAGARVGLTRDRPGWHDQAVVLLVKDARATDLQVPAGRGGGGGPASPRTLVTNASTPADTLARGWGRSRSLQAAKGAARLRAWLLAWMACGCGLRKPRGHDGRRE